MFACHWQHVRGQQAASRADVGHGAEQQKRTCRVDGVCDVCTPGKNRTARWQTIAFKADSGEPQVRVCPRIGLEEE